MADTLGLNLVTVPRLADDATDSTPWLDDTDSPCTVLSAHPDGVGQSFTPPFGSGSEFYTTTKSYFLPFDSAAAGVNVGDPLTVYIDVTVANLDSLDYVRVGLVQYVTGGTETGSTSYTFNSADGVVAGRNVLGESKAVATNGGRFGDPLDPPHAVEVFARFTDDSFTEGDVIINGVRIDRAETATDEPDELGAFCGSTAATDTVTFAWDGEPYASTSTASVNDTPPDPPGPDPSEALTALVDRLAVTHSLTEAERETATEAVKQVITFAYGYTRGQGFTDPDDVTLLNLAGDAIPIPAWDLAPVILAAAGRLLANPSQLLYTVGQETMRSAYSGWTLAEQALLNRYRYRAKGAGQ